MIVSANNKIIWLSVDNDEIFIYTFSRNHELLLLKSVKMNSIFHNGGNFEFTSYCYCRYTNQVFLLYVTDITNNRNSLIIVINLKKLKILSILEMECTGNRKPVLVMHPSRTGDKLFVQETFENKVIFYQVFTLPLHVISP